MEKRLQDYKGFRIIKEIVDKDVYYWLNDQDDNTINVYRSLKDLKKDIDSIWSK